MKKFSIAFLLLILLSSCAVEQPTFEPAYSSTVPAREAAFVVSRDPLTEKYKLAKSLLQKGDEGSLDYAVLYLKEVVTIDPGLEGALTLLGRAYYQQGLYEYAYWILQRALVVNREDDIAWVVIGLTQLRLGDDRKGVENLKGGVVLLSKASTSGYRGFPNWDSRNLVRAGLRRTAFLIVNLDKGLSGKEDVINSTELLLRFVDEEEVTQRGETPANTR